MGRMMKRNIFSRCAVLFLLMCLIFSGCSAPEETQVTAAEEALAVAAAAEMQVPAETEETQAEAKQTLSVAVFQYIPHYNYFTEVLLQEWEEVEPDVELQIAGWDCYAETNGECDLLMYDAVALTHLAENGYIRPIAPEDIVNREDIVPFALDGASRNGECYGVPYYLCGDVMIYYKDDAEVAAVNTIPQLIALNEERRKADPDTGVVRYTEIDDPYHYLQAASDLGGKYTRFEEMPDCRKLDPKVLDRLEKFRSLAMELPETDLENAEMFCQGYGYAFLGLTEHMRFMDNILDKIAVKKLSFSERRQIPLFYIDVVSISSQVTDPEELELCKKLMNLIGSEEFQKKICFEEGKPLYLLPARESVYLSLAEEYPMYGQLHDLVMEPNNKTLRCGAGFYKYIKTFPKDAA